MEGTQTAASNPMVAKVILRVGTPFSASGRLFVRSECVMEYAVTPAAAITASAASEIMMLAMMLSILFARLGLVVGGTGLHLFQYVHQRYCAFFHLRREVVYL